MLIIFDLDDTLIETSDCLTPYYLKRVLQEMEREGLELQNFDKAYEELLELNEKASSSREAIETFWTHRSRVEQVLKAGFKALFSPLPEDLPIKLVPGALALLAFLEKKHRLTLVTAGDPQLQIQKMKKAGIQPSRFSKLIVGRSFTKKESYKELLRDFPSYVPHEVIVCGDRVFADLSPAKELGFFTVHFQNGRGKVHNQPKEDVDLSIETLEEFNKIFNMVSGKHDR